MDRCFFGVRDRRCSSIHFALIVAYGSSKIASYSKEMLESLYVALVSPVHKITFSVEFDSSLTIKSFVGPYGDTECLKKLKSSGIKNVLSNVFPVQLHGLLNHAVFQCHCVDLGMLCLAC